MLVVTIILDGAGVGDAPDAGAYGDAGSNTLGHVIAQEQPHLPNLTRWGLGHLVDGLPAVSAPAASWGRLAATAAGKDSTTGHWELAGFALPTAFPTYPDGFPPDVVDAFCREAGVDGILANTPASGTAVIDVFGPEHEATGRPIVYTSGDSVFQIAAHVDVIPLERLYAMCRTARDRVCVGEHAVGRVIARPFEGRPGAYARLSAARKDYSLPPPAPTLLDRLQAAGVETVCIGKVASLFNGQGVSREVKTAGNADGVVNTLSAIVDASDGGDTFVWTNLVDFDELFGHRGDAPGYAAALEAFDAALPRLEAALPPGALLMLTADHGNDPTTPGSDHTRERVPILMHVAGEASGHDLGTGATFADHAATVAGLFGVAWHGPGTPLGTGL